MPSYDTQHNKLKKPPIKDGKVTVYDKDGNPSTVWAVDAAERIKRGGWFAEPPVKAEVKASEPPEESKPSTGKGKK